MSAVTDDSRVHDVTSVVGVQGYDTTVRRAGDGRSVVFLHGAFFPTHWLPFHERVAERVDLIAPVHPGYMEGGPPDWLRSFDDLVLHYGQLLRQLSVERFDLVGHDIGGWLAAQLAAHAPQRVRSLTVIAPMGLRLPDAPAMEWLAARPATVVEALFNGEPGEHAGMLPPPSDIDGFVRTYGENGVTTRLIWERRYDVGLDRRLAHLSVPAHVVTPDDDRIVPPAHAERWAKLLPTATLTRLPGVGHALLVQAPDTVADAIVDFIEEVPA